MKLYNQIVYQYQNFVVLDDRYRNKSTSRKHACFRLPCWHLLGLGLYSAFVGHTIEIGFGPHSRSKVTHNSLRTTVKSYKVIVSCCVLSLVTPGRALRLLACWMVLTKTNVNF